jgi:hypothetical protein
MYSILIHWWLRKSFYVHGKATSSLDIARSIKMIRKRNLKGGMLDCNYSLLSISTGTCMMTTKFRGTQKQIH